MTLYAHGQIQRGVTGSPDPTPLKNHKNIVFPSNIDPDSLKFTKLPSQPAFKGGPLSTRQPTFNGISIFSPSNQLKKIIVSVGPPLTKLSGSAHDADLDNTLMMYFSRFTAR